MTDLKSNISDLNLKIKFLETSLESSKSQFSAHISQCRSNDLNSSSLKSQISQLESNNKNIQNQNLLLKELLETSKSAYERDRNLLILENNQIKSTH